jgi:TPR repeat protein
MTALLLASCNSSDPVANSQPDTPPPIDVDAVRSKADQGDAASQFLLGEAYLHGRGVRPNPQTAAEWLIKAAGQGSADAQCTLAMMYDAGRGVPPDLAQAHQWFRKAADQNHALAQYNLAFQYASGRGATRNDAESLRWLSRSAQQGEGLAQFALGYRCMDGQGVPKDLAEAYKWFALAEARQIPNSKSAREEVQAKMNRAEFADGRKRAAQFVPGPISSPNK